MIGCNPQELGVRRRDWLQAPACTKQSRECQRVEGDDIVGAAFLFGARPDAGAAVLCQGCFFSKAT
jgi:hypothetical protein